jgi:DNA polymerase-1
VIAKEAKPKARTRERETLMLLDAYGLIYRAFFALPPLSTAKGLPINAVYGFTMMLNKLIAEEKPTNVIAAFDKGMPAHRVQMFSEYKAQRQTMPEDLRGQFALVRRVLDTYGIPIAEIDGQEADDVIATLAAQAEAEGARTLVVTGDLDLLQIVDERTTVLAMRRGITDLTRYDIAAVRERFGLSPSQLADYRGLKGDPSDNLPGIPGIGEKTASKLLQTADTLDALVARPSLAGSPKLADLIAKYGVQAQLCRDVSRADRSLPVEVDWERSRYKRPPDAALYPLFAELEFKTLLARLKPPHDLPLAPAETRIAGMYRNFVPVVDPPEFARLATELRAFADGLVALAIHAGALGVSSRPGEGLALAADALSHDVVRDALRDLLAHGSRRAVHDAKAATHVLRAHGLAAVFDDDTMLGAHLLNPSRTYASLAELATEFLDRSLPDDAAARADATLQATRAIRERLSERDQLRLYEEVEVPLAPVLAEMERTGVAIETAALREIGSEIDTAAGRLQKRIYDFAGDEFNIASPAQLGNVLFGKLQIPGGKKTKTGWATGVEVLAALAREYPICALVLEWREVTKLKNTYVDVIPQLIDPKDGRLHTIFNQTATATGRLSSTNPNLQNIPVRGELGRRIRRAFVAKPGGYVLLAADYSQIELRLMAHLSGDEAMRTAFEDGQDIHDFTARQIFNVAPGKNVDPNQRRMAKSVNFGLLYGMSEFGLAQRLEIPRADAREITKAYFSRFPSVKAYINATLEQARASGYVSTILGRRRYMPALSSANFAIRSAAEREATNAPLQGSAADLMKLAMVRIDRRLKEEKLDAAMLLQIHDELIFEVREADLHRTAHVVRDVMENAMPLSVPLEVTLKSASSWYDVEALASGT